ncbi:hypothetical protein EDD17DRAFT_996024 [Pisolithus thermaeus]|nr:hypothetical protein EDD17DRAFT_996024 [Pisolithus thermaeus]
MWHSLSAQEPDINVIGSQTLPNIADPLNSQGVIAAAPSSTPHSKWVNEFALSKSLSRHEHPGRVWFCPRRGFDLHHAYMYYMHYSEDAWAIRFLVTAVWILSTLHFSFMCHFLYYYLIINYGVPMSFLYVVWSLPASILMHAFVATAVQCFFVHQIYHLCRPQVKWWVTAPMMLSVLAGTGVGVATAILKFLNTETSVSTQLSSHIGTPALVIYMLSEILIAVSLCTLLYDNDSRSTFPSTKRLLNTLIIYAVNRCLLILLITIAELATDIRQLESWTMALDFICQGLYSNTLLASLNTRQYLRAQTSYTVSDLRIRTVNFAKLSKLEGHVESSEDGSRRSGKFEDAVIDITADPALRKEAEV